MSVQVYHWPSCKKLYVGKSGCGKTSLFWKHLQAEKARVRFIYDHKAMEFSLRYLKRKPCFDWDEFIDATARAVEGKGNSTVAFCPSELYSGEPDKGFEDFCTLIFELCGKFRGRKIIVADELQKLVGTRSQPKPLLTVCDVGRTHQMDCFFMASASNALHNLVLGQITECYAFLHGNKNSCEWETIFGYEPEELLLLKKGEYIWRSDTGEARKGGEAF